MQFLAALGILYYEFILFLKLSFCTIPSAAKNWINSVPQTEATTFAFASVFILLYWSGWWGGVWWSGARGPRTADTPDPAGAPGRQQDTQAWRTDCEYTTLLHNFICFHSFFGNPPSHNLFSCYFSLAPCSVQQMESKREKWQKWTLFSSWSKISLDFRLRPEMLAWRRNHCNISLSFLLDF